MSTSDINALVGSIITLGGGICAGLLVNSILVGILASIFILLLFRMGS